MKYMAQRDAYGDTLVRLGQHRKDLVVLDADLSGSTKTGKFAKACPDRFFNCGIAEQNMMSTAAGLAAGGKLVFASTFAVFATGRCWDQIRQSITYPDMNVKIVATHAGITVGGDGASHQCLEDLALMSSLPRMTVVVPTDAVETVKAIEAIAEHRGPCYVRMGRSKVPVLTDEDDPFEIGRATLLREGHDISLIGTGQMVAACMEAAESLAANGISAEVINMSTIKPLDTATIASSVASTGCVVTAEEHNIIGGLGSHVASFLVESCPVPMERIGVRDRFGESGEPEELLEKYGLTGHHVAEAAVRVIGRK